MEQQQHGTNLIACMDENYRAHLTKCFNSLNDLVTNEENDSVKGVGILAEKILAEIERLFTVFRNVQLQEFAREERIRWKLRKEQPGGADFGND